MSNIRDAFVSRFGNEGLIVEFDCCQLEICALAEITGDTTLIEELNTGVDIHRENASLWLKKPSDEVTEKERKLAKVMTFQLQYGAKAPKIAETLGISIREAEEFIAAFYRKYHSVDTYHANLSSLRKSYRDSLKLQTDPSREYIKLNTTPTGRVYTIKPRQTDKGDWYYSLTEMKNYPIQGFATGDIVPILVNIIMDNLHTYSMSDCAIPVGTVHDSIVFDCKAEDVKDLLKLVEMSFRDFPNYFKSLFEYELQVKYNYDVKIGHNWNGKSMEKLTRKDVQDLLTSE